MLAAREGTVNVPRNRSSGRQWRSVSKSPAGNSVLQKLQALQRLMQFLSWCCFCFHLAVIIQPGHINEEEDNDV